MRLEDQFQIQADRQRSWQLLQDIPSVAACLPGAQLVAVSDPTCVGKVKVKIGPIVMTYDGQLEFIRRDEEQGLMSMRAQGRDKRGSGSVSADIELRLTEAGSNATTGTLVVDLDITGKPAQFGRSALQDVTSRLIQQFAANLSVLAQDEERGTGTSTALSTTGSTTPVNAEAIDAFDLLSGGRRRTFTLAALSAAGLLAFAVAVRHRLRTTTGTPNRG